MTVIYMDQDMRLAAPRNGYQQADWDGWCPGAKIGELIDSPLNPVLWTREGSDKRELIRRNPRRRFSTARESQLRTARARA